MATYLVQGKTAGKRHAVIVEADSANDAKDATAAIVETSPRYKTIAKWTATLLQLPVRIYGTIKQA